jgi:hypothetical protein
MAEPNCQNGIPPIRQANRQNGIPYARMPTYTPPVPNSIHPYPAETAATPIFRLHVYAYRYIPVRNWIQIPPKIPHKTAKNPIGTLIAV